MQPSGTRVGGMITNDIFRCYPPSASLPGDTEGVFHKFLCSLNKIDNYKHQNHHNQNADNEFHFFSPFS
jgi:hypothetical protein